MITDALHPKHVPFCQRAVRVQERPTSIQEVPRDWIQYWEDIERTEVVPFVCYNFCDLSISNDVLQCINRKKVNRFVSRRNRHYKTQMIDRYKNTPSKRIFSILIKEQSNKHK